MLVDLATIRVTSGQGGNGCVSFRREKYVPKGGPDGGTGGRGGDVILIVDAHVRTLLDCRERPQYRAERGGAGSGNNRSGKDGENLVVHVPPGTLVRDADTGETIADLIEPGTEWVAARGGRGGRGNSSFATATHQAPRRADPGEPSETRNLVLELKLIADVGLVGLPNAGKSTMLARLSRARPKIAPYPFTTLEPHLGIVELDPERRFVLADLPGLIEGAHIGKGLGLDFLRHVERTRALVLVADAASESPADDVRLVLGEIERYSPALLERPRLLVLSKADLIPVESHGELAARAGLPDALVVSAHSGVGLATLLERLWAMLAAAEPAATEG